ncbi:LOW QUALITY PROTEIN: peroxisomal leader peptide-processing protease [Apus apus]|uniref:LOW QUALITY PROTEIN: peroxisomal leader peptide-processing protease n=1 Tax=Apus apus TaxID=8895 RepID=UPI0021F8D494|nr:LOW QUALITY PROTEIN: peroxisomal leader peptide-processing protease [Apus apus]
MAEERGCCAVTVSGPAVTQPGPGGSGSCSGVVLSRQPGLVLCHAAVFAPFVRAGPQAWAQPRALPPDAVRGGLRIAALQPPARGLGGGYRRHEARLLALVPCGAFRQAVAQALGPAEEPWRFGGKEEEEEEGGRQALHWFAWLRVPGLDSAEGGWTARADAGGLRKGEVLLACGSPFGALCPDLFLNTLSRGVVSNLAGRQNALILTDARCLPGTEGGGVFLPSPDGPRLVAVIAASFCWKGAEWVGLTLLCSLSAILRSSARLLEEAGLRVPPPGDGRLAGMQAGAGQDPLGWAVLVECGAAWGSGVLLTPRLLLTCRHVLEAGGPPRVTPAPGPGRVATGLEGRVVFATEESSPFDVAVVELEGSVPGFSPPRLADTFLPGEEVSVVGFGALGRACGPSVTAGVLSSVVAVAGHPVMLQTTCAVHGGSSGGPLISSRSGCLLGIVASNARDTGAGATYPHLNFCIPISVLQGPIERYRRTGDPAAFAELNRAGQGVRAAWRLQRQPGPPSKL